MAGYKMESREARTLGTITAQSYDYRDQAKVLIKQGSDIGYIAAYIRKMQRGIDAANENFVQQIGDFINDILSLLAGNGDTGFDWGDVKYIFQMFGSLFGIGNQDAPFNFFDAAWHFFFTYIIPLESFDEVINMLVDGVIATILDVFGEVPILGEAAEQLAVWLSDIRDLVLGINDFVGDLISDGIGTLKDIIDGIVDAIVRAVTGGSDPGGFFTDIFNAIFGIKQTADIGNTDHNPAIVALDGRISGLYSAGSNWFDNLARSSLGPGYTAITGPSSFAFPNTEAIGSNGSICAYVDTGHTFSTSKNYIQWKLYLPFGVQGEIILSTMSNTTLSNYAGIRLFIGSFGVGSGGEIVSGTSFGSYTSRSPYYGYGWQNGDVVGIGYDPATTTYVMYVNNVAVETWNDSAHIVHDSTNRNTGATFRSNGTGGTGAFVDEIAAYDWA